ncbi:hypothetical protein AeNC1_013308 [Aphanomyces euteiches]|nr:hypothetical protein AeNC1_013308 [Aphanomyces euteiches]
MMSSSSSAFDCFVHDFMQLNHNPVDEALNLQSRTERLLDRWRGLALKKGSVVDLDSVEDRIQRNIHRHEKMLVWLNTMEQHMHHDALAFADADGRAVQQVRDRPMTEPALVIESETILKQIDALLIERREWEQQAPISMA